MRKKGNSYQADIMVNGTRYRRSFSTPRDAAVWEEELKRRKSLGLDISELVNDKDDLTLEEAMERTWKKFWKGTDSDYGNIQKMKEIMTFFPRSLLLKDLSSTMIDDFVDWLEDFKNNAPATINNKLNILSKTLNFAFKRELIEKVPHIERKKLTQGKPKFFSNDEVKQIRAFFQTAKPILRGVDNSVIHDYFRWSLHSGCRSEEVTKLNMETDIREDPILGLVVDIDETKNELYRCNPLTNVMKEIYEARKHEVTPFKQLHQKNRWRIWQKVREYMDNYDPEWIMYLTRHTCASRLVQADVNLLQIQKYLGHRKIETTMRYATIAPKDLLKVSSALNAFTSESRKAVPPETYKMYA